MICREVLDITSAPTTCTGQSYWEVRPRTHLRPPLLPLLSSPPQRFQPLLPILSRRQKRCLPLRQPSRKCPHVSLAFWQTLYLDLAGVSHRQPHSQPRSQPQSQPRSHPCSHPMVRNSSPPSMHVRLSNTLCVSACCVSIKREQTGMHDVSSACMMSLPRSLRTVLCNPGRMYYLATLFYVTSKTSF